MNFKIISTKDLGKRLYLTEEKTGNNFIVSKDELQDAIDKLWLWLTNPMDTSFSTLLYSLIAKADDDNFKKLLKGFPIRTSAYLIWYGSTDEQAFWDENLTKTEVQNG